MERRAKACAWWLRFEGRRRMRKPRAARLRGVRELRMGGRVASSERQRAAMRKKRSAAREGETHQAPRAQEAARLWLLPSGPDQVHAAPLLGTRRTPPSRAARRLAERGGFEPPATLWAALAFQASSLSRSVTSPRIRLLARAAARAPGR